MTSAPLRPNFWTADLANEATLLVTMGCDDACPFVPGLKKIDWDLADPRVNPSKRLA